ncbi:MAG: alpha-glucan family phosphorylase [Cytophaga sp.]|uniref:alpha-glucan family phosphorylase n=1 Tax=Cytophaga sp. TaxID=29535 RepID=UPI003F7DE6B5
MSDYSSINQEYNTSVAYFSMEYAIHQPLKVYSGGLGFLSGSHMRSAYDLKQNLVGVGMLWKYGYYDQGRNEDLTMRVDYTTKYYSFFEDPDIKVQVTVFGKDIWVKAYRLKPETFGSAPIYFLTTDLPENDYLSRTITNYLYDPNEETRIAQSIVLGIGGGRVLDAVNRHIDIYHINEAHALPIGFHLYDKYKNWNDVKSHLVFTTHTPEKAGNESHNFDLLKRASFFGSVPEHEINVLDSVINGQFEYSLAALRMAKKANGVSELHGIVARDMWKDFANICPIDHITNSQHVGYWADKALLQAYHEHNDHWIAMRKKELKKQLFEVIADQTGDILDPDVLTIVWCRRFAGYKRPDLIMRDYNRFINLITNNDQPIQVIWAGKPYPKDQGAIDIFNKILQTTLTSSRAVILVGYELGLSALLKRGADIWLNNPRYTREASGTSGMTAAMNATLNLSNLDGWVKEFGKNMDNSFIMQHADSSQGMEEQDNQDARFLYEIMEQQVIPTYYTDQKKWSQMIRRSMDDIFPFFNSDRMADEYYKKLYNA